MIGLVAVPILFVWFLFRPGYARTTRTAALIYTFAGPALNLAFATIGFLCKLPAR